MIEAKLRWGRQKRPIPFNPCWKRVSVDTARLLLVLVLPRRELAFQAAWCSQRSRHGRKPPRHGYKPWKYLDDLSMAGRLRWSSRNEGEQTSNRCSYHARLPTGLREGIGEIESRE